MNDSQPYIITFLSKKEVAKDTYTFTFKKPEGFDFQPGQYNRWTLPLTATDGRGSARFFTISSSPLEKETISLTTKIIQSDFKKVLLNLNPQDEIKIFGPMGNFILNETDTRTQIFIAGGVGITPFHSMISYAVEKGLNIPIFLFASYSVPEEMMFFNKLKMYESKHSPINIIYTITKPEKSQIPWTGETGRISETMIKKYVRNMNDCVFSIVGPPPMVEGIITFLNDIHIPSGNILTEQFTGY